MKLTKFPKEIAAEILSYIAENEPLTTLEKFEDSSLEDVRELLREISEQLKLEGSKEFEGSFNYKDSELSDRSKQVIGCLSPREERVLFKSFGIK